MAQENGTHWETLGNAKKFLWHFPGGQLMIGIGNDYNFSTDRKERVREIGVHYRAGHPDQWRFSLKGETDGRVDITLAGPPLMVEWGHEDISRIVAPPQGIVRP